MRHLDKDSRGHVFVKDATLVEIESPEDVRILIDTLRQRLEPDSSLLHAASTEHIHSHVVVSIKLVEMRLNDDYDPEKSCLLFS